MLYKATWNKIKQVAHVTSVGWVSKFSNTCWIHFSQNNLQKILVSLLFYFLNHASKQGINILKFWIIFHNVDSHKFENNQSSLEVLTNWLLLVCERVQTYYLILTFYWFQPTTNFHILPNFDLLFTQNVENLTCIMGFFLTQVSIYIYIFIQSQSSQSGFQSWYHSKGILSILILPQHQFYQCCESAWLVICLGQFQFWVPRTQLEIGFSSGIRLELELGLVKTVTNLRSSCLWALV